MSEHRITVAGGSSVRLPTEGKYCDRDIIVTGEGGGTELPTLDTPAAETDVVKGKEYIDANGVKKTGAVEEADTQIVMGDVVDFSYDGELFVTVGMIEKDTLARAGCVAVGFIPPAWLGDATRDDVVAGKTFTSATGVRVPGAAKLGPPLPTLDDPAGENDIREGKEYIDANGVKRYGRLKMDGVWTPDWSTYVPIEVQYDSDDRFLVMKNTDGVGGGLETVEVAMCDYMDRGLTVYYTDRNGQIQQTTLPLYDITIEAVKNSIIVVEGYSDDIYPVDYGGGYSPVSAVWNVKVLTMTFSSNGYIRLATA